MLRLSLLALWVLGIASTAQAADLTQLPARQSRLGAVFADAPPRHVRVEETAPADHSVLYFIPPKVPGYYGKPTDFAYGNYYGTSPLAIFGRLPYACGVYGSC